MLDASKRFLDASKLLVSMRLNLITHPMPGAARMKITILDDYHDTLRTLNAYRMLDGKVKAISH